MATDGGARITNSAGISAGIDMSPHLVANMAGALELDGQLLAAHAALLLKYEASTHHQHLEELRQADRTCRVQANHVFVTDGPACSSAGVTTGIDLMLHRVSGGVAPLQYEQRVRLDVAEVALRSGYTVSQAAELACFASDLHQS